MQDSAYIPEKSDASDSETRFILVVEDDAGLNNLIRKTLDKAGYKTAGVSTGEGAIEYVVANPETVLLIDMKLPDITGKEIVDSLREMNTSVPFIVVTGHGDERMAVEMMRLGASDYLPKSLGFLERLPAAFQRLFRERATEKRLRAAEGRIKMLSSAVEQSLEGIVLTDLSGIVTFVNKAWRLMHGFDSAQDLVGRSVSIFHTPEQFSQEVLPFQKKMLLTGSRTEEINHLRRDGSVFPTFMAVHILKDENDQPTSIVSMARNISRHKKAEAERMHLVTAIEQSADTIVITDTDAVIQFANPSFERITGYFPSEAIGQNPRILQSGQHDESFYKDMWRTLLSGKTWSGRLINKKKDGSIFTEEATITPVHNPSGEIVNYVAVKRDISREIKLEEQLRQSHKMEAVGQLAGGVAHDFNNILQGIFGYVMFAQEGLDLEEKRYKDIEEIRKCAERAAQLTKQLLSFSRRQIMQPKNINLNNLIDEILKMIRRVIGEHIELEFVSGTNLDVVYADPGQIEQVILNLCVNARDSMPGGGRLILETSNITVDSDNIDSYTILEPGQYVLFSVSDTGIGMDSETLAHIFEPFFTTKTVGKGTGLGLSMVHGIVKQHNGFIHTYSEIDKGTIFRIYLPVAEESERELVHSEVEPTFSGTETILVAEDDQSVRDIVVRILEGAGYTVYSAIDGETGVSLFMEHVDEVDLALLDVVMPKFGGAQMLLQMREQKPNLPVLFSSGYSEGAIHTGFVLDEGIMLIQKPYNANELLRRVRITLDEAKQK